MHELFHWGYHTDICAHVINIDDRMQGLVYELYLGHNSWLESFHAMHNKTHGNGKGVQVYPLSTYGEVASNCDIIRTSLCKVFFFLAYYGIGREHAFQRATVEYLQACRPSDKKMEITAKPHLKGTDRLSIRNMCWVLETILNSHSFDICWSQGGRLMQQKRPPIHSESWLGSTKGRIPWRTNWKKRI